ncbi:MAG: protein kinase [Planctomycetaceae bacterium]|nr:protein kinase [Planctomycetaceae bacterium]
MDPTLENSPSSESEQIGALCARYEASVRRGERPALRAFLGDAAGPARRRLLESLLLCDLRLRRERGEPVSPAEYQANFPDESWITGLVSDTNAALESPETIQLSTAPTANQVVSESRYERLVYHNGGGLGDIFRAVDTDLNRQVALKFIKQNQARDPDSRTRFLVEAEVTGRLDHPSVVPVYGLGESADGRPFYAMRFIEGTTLAEAIKRLHEQPGDFVAGRRTEFRCLLGHFIAACNTIAYAHDRGVVHCDLKPANIMIGKYNETLVLDWGLALSIDNVPARTSGPAPTLLVPRGGNSSRLGGGTPGYMSPEQLPGAERPVSPASDIYSLGATLYELLTGQTAINPRSATVMDEIRRNQFSRPRSVNAAVPPALEAICLKAMATNPAERYRTAQELAADVEAWLGDDVVSAYCEPRAETVSRWFRRHQTWALSLGTATALVALISVLAALLWSGEARRERAAREQAVRERHAANVARESGMRMAARFAATTVANEIDLRWHILQAHAHDNHLYELMREAEGQNPLEPATKTKLKEWIAHHYQAAAAMSDSWFLTDRHGRQIARYPHNEKTVGEDFSRRDYFHGLGRTLAPDEAAQAEPISDVHISTVYLSTDNGRPKVAFTVPVIDENSGDGKPLGVLGMSVEVGAFAVLQSGLSSGQIAVLVDTREDWIDQAGAEGRVGLFLHHPELRSANQRRLKQGILDQLRLEVGEVAALHKLIDLRLQEESNRPDGSPPDSSPVELPGSFRRDYRDLATGAEVLVTAAFEPVLVPRRSVEIKRTGWVVIVQENVAVE